MATKGVSGSNTFLKKFWNDRRVVAGYEAPNRLTRVVRNVPAGKTARKLPTHVVVMKGVRESFGLQSLPHRFAEMGKELGDHLFGYNDRGI